MICECRKRKQSSQSEKVSNDPKDCAFLVTNSDSEDVKQIEDYKKYFASNSQVSQLLEQHFESVWITDSGASKHITFRRDWLTNFQPAKGHSIALCDNGLCEVLGSGTVFIEKLVNSELIQGKIENVLYVPQLKKNLFSVVCIRRKGLKCISRIIVLCFYAKMKSGLKEQNKAMSFTDYFLDPHVDLHYPNDNENLIAILYRKALGSLMFLAIISRPDISFAVGLVSRFVDKHDASHWQAVKRILRYLSGTSSFGIMYGKGGSNLELLGYLNADFAGDVTTRRPTTR